jgi:hypothetical protein
MGATVAAEIKRAQAAVDPDDGSTYYHTGYLPSNASWSKET